MLLRQATPSFDRRLSIQAAMWRIVVDISNPTDQSEREVIEFQSRTRLRIRIALLKDAAEGMTGHARCEIGRKSPKNALNCAALWNQGETI